MKRGTTMGHAFSILLAVAFCRALSLSQSSNPAITAEELQAHVKFLASDELEGRASGTEGNTRAAEYVAERFKQYGLAPLGDAGGFFQAFDFVSAVRLGNDNSLSLTERKGTTVALKLDEDFRPLGFSSNGTVSGTLVFVGYGISAPESGYDDYQSVDVTGKVAVALRYGPDGNDLHSEFYKHTSFRNKARIARDKGAVGLILITGPKDEESDELVKLSYDNSFASSGIVALSMKRSPIESYLLRLDKNLKVIQDSIKQNQRPQSFDISDVTVAVRTDVIQVVAKTANVVGSLEGNDPVLKNQTVVVGAHLDHLGYGGPGSGSLMPDAHEIHNGADDNASGTAGLLELAQAFGARKGSLARTLLFIAFSGEELGTLGSSYYVNHPSLPLSETICMVNMDMVGRLEGKSLTVYGTGTSPLWPPLLVKSNPESTFTLKPVADGFGPSDHAQFYAKDIPVLFFFTGTHNDYHKPSDDWDKLNYPGEEKVIRYVYSIVSDLDSRSDRPAFVKTQLTAMGGGDSRGFSVTLGVIPDYGEGTEGMKIGGIRPGGPAEKAGLKPGDVITRLAGKKVLNIYDFMGILGELKAGEEVDVVVLRDGKTITSHTTMEKRK